MESYIRKSNLKTLGFTLDDKTKQFVVNNGVIKEFKPGRFTWRLIKDNNIFIKLSDLPIEAQGLLASEVITEDELKNVSNKKTNDYNIYTEEDTKVFVNGNTPVLPIVGNFLPSDGINAYTAVYKEDGTLTLEAILVNWNCHWSDLFSGETKYGDNVFCLASDLPVEVIERFADDIIPLSAVPDLIDMSKGKSR